MTGPTLEIRNVTYSFGPREVLENINLSLAAGQTLALVGPSGSGKSTLLHLCAGLLTLRKGRIENGFARTSLLFQQAHLLPWKTVLDNIALGLKAAGAPRQQRLQAAAQMGQAMGLDPHALGQFPRQLSGGMQSRAALARALVLQPDLLLLDEPFSALDIGLKRQMHQLLLAEQLQRKLAVFMITHDLMEAVTLADRIAVLGGEPARVSWMTEFALAPQNRSDAWIYQQTAQLLAQEAIQSTFDLSPRPGECAEIGPPLAPKPIGSPEC